MFSATTIAAVAALFAGAASAAPTIRQENCDPAQQPFNLTVTSLNSGKYSSAPLAAAHSGAAQEALAVLDFGTSYTFNQTDITPPSGYCGVGYLQYILPSEPNDIVEKLNVFQNSSSNVAAGFFTEGPDPILLTISNTGELFYYDGSGAADSYWYVCPQTTLGYQYNTLSHVADGSPPDNVDCDQVTVRKIGGA